MAGIEQLFFTQVDLLHNQTAETDGNCKLQREGWPAAGHPTPIQ